MTPTPAVRRVLLAVAMLLRRWNLVMLGCWVVSLTVAAGLAAIVWGESGFGIGVLASGATVLIALAIVWLLRVGARSLP